MENQENAIVMTAELGSRIGELTKKVPKPLIQVNGIPLIETVIRELKYRGVQEIITVVGYLKEQFSYLENWNLFWEEVVDKNIEEFNLEIFPVSLEEIIEIDTQEEMRSILNRQRKSNGGVRS